MEECTNSSSDTKKGRGRWEIIRDILRATIEDGKVRKTRIMQRSYLDWRTFHKYFEYLLGDGFLAECYEDECFVLTEKGRELLKRLEEVAEVLDQA